MGMSVIGPGGAASLEEQRVSFPHSGVPGVTPSVLELWRARLDTVVRFMEGRTKEHLHPL